MRAKLLVGNISNDANEDCIRDLFSGTAGVVISVSIPLKPGTKMNRGYALVEMNSEPEAQQAMHDLNGVSVGGRAMSISMVEQVQAAKKWYQFGAR